MRRKGPEFELLAAAAHVGKPPKPPQAATRWVCGKGRPGPDANIALGSSHMCGSDRAEPRGHRRGQNVDPAKMTYSRIAFFERPCNSCGQRQNEQQQHAKQQPRVGTTVNRAQAARCSHALSGEERMGEGGSAVRH